MKLTLVQSEIEQAIIAYMRQTVFTSREDMPIRCSFSTTRNPITVVADIEVDIFGKDNFNPTDDYEKKSSEVEDKENINSNHTDEEEIHHQCGPGGCHIDWDTTDPNETVPEKEVSQLFNDMTMPTNK